MPSASAVGAAEVPSAGAAQLLLRSQPALRLNSDFVFHSRGSADLTTLAKHDRLVSVHRSPTIGSHQNKPRLPFMVVHSAPPPPFSRLHCKLRNAP